MKMLLNFEFKNPKQHTLPLKRKKLRIFAALICCKKFLFSKDNEKRRNSGRN